MDEHDLARVGFDHDQCTVVVERRGCGRHDLIVGPLAPGRRGGTQPRRTASARRSPSAAAPQVRSHI
jgi:hypothetical protein